MLTLGGWMKGIWNSCVNLKLLKKKKSWCSDQLYPPWGGHQVSVRLICQVILKFWRWFYSSQSSRSISNRFCGFKQNAMSGSSTAARKLAWGPSSSGSASALYSGFPPGSLPFESPLRIASSEHATVVWPSFPGRTQIPSRTVPETLLPPSTSTLRS